MQSYSYDALNRLQSATETFGTNNQQSWKQTFSYDRFGNRRFDASNTTTPNLQQQAEKIANPQIETSNNRLKSDQDADGQTDYEYDLAGNLTKDATGKLFAYDAEGRQKSFGTNTAANNGATYAYDGAGKRVKKSIPLADNIIQETIFVYDAFGKLAAEYETNIAPPENPTTKFLTTDHLGSPRIITDSVGKVVSRHDYQAFGEEIYAGVASRSTDDKYNSADNIRQQFTGYERDTESGLDYAQARYYNSRHGRFTSVDPLTASATIKNPQTFNRYSYALNSPYKFVDPLGLAAVVPNSAEATSNPCKGGNNCSDPQTQNQEQQKQRNIYIFVAFTDDEQTSTGTHPRTGEKVIINKPPNFQGLADSAPAGTNVIVSIGLAATATRFRDALEDPDAAAVIFVGHGSGTTENGVFSATGLLFNGASRYSPDENTSSDVRAKTVGIFSCDGENTANLFEGRNKPSIIATDSGTDGLSNTVSLAQAGYAAAKSIIEGKSANQATASANSVFLKANGSQTRGGVVYPPNNNFEVKTDRIRKLP